MRRRIQETADSDISRRRPVAPAPTSTTADVRQTLFVNLQLLGLNRQDMEKRWKIAFHRDMFNVPNKKASEVVMQFLFEKLNPVKAKEVFRDCWPVLDKKQEQEFRKACTSWLSGISKSDESAHLPHTSILNSVFMSPGGDKFCLLLLAFSRYVLMQRMMTDYGVPASEAPRHPEFNSATRPLHAAMERSYLCQIQRNQSHFHETLRRTTVVQDEWKHVESEKVRVYRDISRRSRDLEKEMETVSRGIKAAGLSRSFTTTGDSLTEDEADTCMQRVDSANRTRLLQEIRTMWQEVEQSFSACDDHRQILDTAISGEVDSYRINGRDLHLKVPEMLIRECEAEIGRRNISNVYEGGKLNLQSLLQLWNLSLYLYLEKFKQVGGLPDVSSTIPKVKSQLEALTSFLSKTKALREKVEVQVIPDLKKSTTEARQQLYTKLDADGLSDSSQAASFGLLPPTPVVTFEACEDDTPRGLTLGDWTAQQSSSDNTPEAAQKLLDTITRRARTQHQNPNSPLLGGEVGQIIRQMSGGTIVQPSRRQQAPPVAYPGATPTSGHMFGKQSGLCQTSLLHQAHKAGMRASKTDKEPSSQVASTLHGKSSPGQVKKRSKPVVTRVKSQTQTPVSRPRDAGPLGAAHKSPRKTASIEAFEADVESEGDPTFARLQMSRSQPPSQPEAQLNPWNTSLNEEDDLLAEEIVNRMMLESPRETVHSKEDSLSPGKDEEASDKQSGSSDMETLLLRFQELRKRVSTPTLPSHQEANDPNTKLHLEPTEGFELVPTKWKVQKFSLDLDFEDSSPVTSHKRSSGSHRHLTGLQDSAEAGSPYHLSILDESESILLPASPQL